MMKRFLQRENTRMYHVWLRSFMVCLCLALAGVSAWGQTPEGVGTKEDPYQLDSKEDLEWFRDRVNAGYPEACAVLTKDIDFNGQEWNSPIQTFEGIFNGANKTISNFKFVDKYKRSQPFFSTNKGNITNLKLISSVENNIIVEETHSAILCQTNEGIIEYCDVTINITVITQTSSFRRFGIISGCNQSSKGINKGIIKGCNVNGNVTIKATTQEQGVYLGGISGELIGGQISECANNANLNIVLVGQSTPSGWVPIFKMSIGGIVGNIDRNKFSDDSIVEKCYNRGDLIIKSESNQNFKDVLPGIGGIVGNKLEEDILKGCYNTGNISVQNLTLETTVILPEIFSTISGIVNSNSFEGCYNTGKLEFVNVIADLKVYGDLATTTRAEFNQALIGNHISNNFYSGKRSIGFSNDDFEGEITDENKPYVITKITDNLLTSGEMAWALREYGYGLTLPNVTNAYPTLRCFDKNLLAVYQLKYNKDTEVTQYYNPGQITEALPELESDLRWFGEDGTIYESGFSMPAKDLVLTAETGYSITKQVEHGTISIAPNQTLYKAGTPITVTVKADEGYQFKSLECKTADTDVSVMNNNDGTYSFTMPDADVTISAVFEKIKYTVTVTVSDDSKDMGTVEGGGEYAEGDPVTITATPNEGYELVFWDVEGVTETTKEGNTIKFIMPANNVTVTATFKEKEDPTDPEEPVDPPVDPINYYNIYNETTYDFIDVSFSRNVVREGGSVNVYLEIPEGLDPAAVTLMFKRGMYGYWENLNTDDDGNYPIRNIWTDIYVKAVVDESYIDPNPDENHIYIDLSETNDSIWLYTDHKLVEEGKTAVIQAGVAKSCQNKEIRYMYKRTVLGEWKEMPKDYSINQYVVRDITTDIYVKAYFVFDKQDPTTAKNPHHVYADITATCEGLYLDATRHKVADEGDTKVFLYVKKGFETKDARYLFKRGLKGEWEDLVPGIEQNTFQVTDIEGDIYLKGIDAVYTGTEDIDGMVRVYTKDGSLFVYTAQPEEISVVSMTGVTVKRTRQTGLQSYPLNQGIYVVCVGEQVFKVRVK